MPYPRRSDELSEVRINARVTVEEREMLKRAAAANFQTISEFVRDVVTNAVSESIEEEPDPN